MANIALQDISQNPAIHPGVAASAWPETGHDASRRAETKTRGRAQTGPATAAQYTRQEQKAHPLRVSAVSRAATFFILSNKQIVLTSMRNLYQSQQQAGRTLAQLAGTGSAAGTADTAAPSTTAVRNPVSTVMLTSINGNLHKIQQLTLRASSAAITISELRSIRSEINALVTEIRRISSRHGSVDSGRLDKRHDSSEIVIPVDTGDDITAKHAAFREAVVNNAMQTQSATKPSAATQAAAAHPGVDPAQQDIAALHSKLDAMRRQLESAMALATPDNLKPGDKRHETSDFDRAATLARDSQDEMARTTDVAVLVQANQTSRGVSALLR